MTNSPILTGSYRRKALVISTLCLWVAACVEQPGIRTYTVDKETSERSPPGTAWFFKLLGPSDEVKRQVESFGTLVRSVRFDSEGQPTWQLPDGWSERRESGIRFATIAVRDAEPPLEVSVTALPISGANYVKENLDRWRGQLGLPAHSEGDWRKQAEADGAVAEVESNGKRITIVQLEGTTDQHGAARMLAAIVPQEGSAPRAPALRTPRSDSPVLPFTYTVPVEWKEGTPGAFHQAVFNVMEGDKTVEISISSARGTIADNIDRWRNQVGLGPASPDERQQTPRPIDIDGANGAYVDLAGATEAILGVIVPRGGTNWFFKLRGDKDLAAREKERFDAFVQSVRFIER